MSREDAEIMRRFSRAMLEGNWERAREWARIATASHDDQGELVIDEATRQKLLREVNQAERRVDRERFKTGGGERW